MKRILGTIFLSVFFVCAMAEADQVTDHKATFVKCPKSDCQYKVKVNGEVYKIVSSSEFELDNEVQSIFSDLEKETAKESKPFCVTGKIISTGGKREKN